MIVFVDSNVPMYLVGAEHPHKIDAQRALERCVANRDRLVTDAEVLQEILHRYTAMGRRDAIRPTLDAVLAVVDEVLPIGAEEVERAAEVVLGNLRLSARDALHVAVMRQHGIENILTFDRDYDAVPGLRRLPR